MNNNQNKFKIYINDKNHLIIKAQEDIKSGYEFDLNDIIESNKEQQEFNKLSDNWIKKQTNDLKNELKIELENSIRLEINNKNKDLINELNKKIDLKQQEINNLISTNKKEIDLLCLELKNKSDQELNQQRDNFNQTINKLNQEINVLKETKSSEIEKEKISLENKFKDDINDLKNDIRLKVEKLKSLEEKYKTEIENIKYKEKEKHNEEIKNKQLEISDLKNKIDILERTRKQMNIKTIGNNLENWCYAEVRDKLVNNLDDFSIEQDHIKEGTKADFVVSIIPNENQKFSITLEMKAELPDSDNKKTNLYHCEKLLKDAKKNNSQIAILVTELELDDDFMFKRFQDDNTIKENIDVYWVRPYGLVYLLSILRLIVLKYASFKIQEIEFKEKQKILESFEEFKKNILDNSLKNIQNQIKNIKKANEAIIKQTETIEEATRVIINTHIKNIENKINDFKIENKVIKKIEKIKNQ